MELVDTLPAGLSYVEGSARIDGAPVSVTISDDGRILRIPLGPLVPGEARLIQLAALAGPVPEAGDVVNAAHAEALTAGGTAVYAEDHLGHGHSEGDRALIVDFEHIVDDLETLAGIAADAHPGVPTFFAGHSMGGLLSSRYTQRHPDRVAGLILLGAVVGDWTWARDVLELLGLADLEAQGACLVRTAVEVTP